MYAYDQFDHDMVHNRVEEFRDQVQRRLTGELTEDEFKPIRLMNGLYLQLHAYMLRVAIPYGTLSSQQMQTLAFIADTYDRGYGHFTTRQNIQFNWPKLVDTPDILTALLGVEMHAIQTSGNCIRNVTTDHFAGAARDEYFDTRPYAELIRQWSTLHPEFSFLPRKFKIAISGAKVDRAALRWHDIALQAALDDQGNRGFEIFVGGGMGRSPFVAKSIQNFVPEDKLLAYLEAMLRVYNQAGRRDNKYKARIKILIHEMGLEAYRDAVENEYEAMQKSAVDAPAAELARLQQYFPQPTLIVKEDTSAAVDQLGRDNPLFGAWIAQNIHLHKTPGYRIVTISLKPHGGIAGDATSDQMRVVADLAERYSLGEIRVSHEQNLILPHVALDQLPEIFKTLEQAGLATPNAGLLTDMIVCPGLDYCALANARSIPLSQKIARRFDDIKRLQNIGEVKVKISGCINSCGHHHAGHIGILGVDKKGVENYQILLGGSGAEDASKAKILGPGFDEDGIVDAIETIIDVYLRERQSEERFLDCYRRLGPTPFKEAVYDH